MTAPELYHGWTDHEKALAANGAACALLIQGLIDLATYYETHPSALLPASPILAVHVPEGTDEERRAFVDAFAASVGTEARTEYTGNYIARRQFGPILLEAHFWSREAKLRHLARHSYDDCVQVYETTAQKMAKAAAA